MHQTRSGEQYREMVLAAGFSQAALAALLPFGRTISLFQVIGLSEQTPGHLTLQLQGSWVLFQTCPLAWELVLGAFAAATEWTPFFGTRLQSRMGAQQHSRPLSSFSGSAFN